MIFEILRRLEGRDRQKAEQDCVDEPIIGGGEDHHVVHLPFAVDRAAMSGGMRTMPASVIVRKNAHRPAPTPRRGGCSATLSGFRSWPGRVCDDAVSASIA